MNTKNLIKTFTKFDFGLIFFFLYALLSILYYQERTLFLDNPFQVFHMIVEDKIEIMAGRWPASIIRWLPFLAVKAELPLQVVLHIFSFSYLLFHFIVFAILRWWMQEKKVANFYALWLLLISGHAFFWNNSELIQACSVLFIWMALVKQEDSGLLRRVGLLSCLIVLLFYHPLILIPIVAVLLLWILQNPKRAKEYLVYLFSTVILYGVKSSMFTNWYDAGKKETFNNNLKEHGLGILNSEGFLNNVQSFFTSWNATITIICIAAMYFFCKERKWLLVLGLPLGILLYNVLIAFADPNIGYAFYNEVNFIPLTAIILLGCMQLSHRIIDSKAICIVLLLFFVFRISYNSRFYSDRIQYWSGLVSELDTKTLKNESELAMDTLIMSWASPYESLLINKLIGGIRDKTLLVHPNAKQFKDTQKSNIFLSHFKSYTIEEVNNRYFDLDLSEGYKTQ